MNIRILHMIEGAKQARGLTVVIDVFRAFTVETYLSRANAEQIIPVGDMQIAFDYKKEHPENTVLCGERKGVIIDGFDYGNSPSQIAPLDLTGKTVIHTTSAGTQGIANAIHANEIIGGNLVAAEAIAEYIRRKNALPKHLIFSFAKLIEFYKKGTPIDDPAVIETMQKSSIAEILANKDFWDEDLSFLTEAVEKASQEDVKW